MISSELRNRKARLIANIGYESACAYQNSCFEAAHVLNRQLSALNLAYQDVDRELFWFSIYVSRMVGEFIASDARNFTAFAMFKACQAFQGLQLDEPEQQPVSHPLDETADDFSYYIALLSPETADKNRSLAEHWREETEYRYQGGLVIVFGGEATGWINQLRDPNHWEPGVIAVDEHGNQYQAIGGDSYNGATSWQPVWNIQPLNGAAA